MSGDWLRADDSALSIDVRRMPGTQFLQETQVPLRLPPYIFALLFAPRKSEPETPVPISVARLPTNLAGLPATIVSASTLFITIDPAPITAACPISTPGPIKARARNPTLPCDAYWCTDELERNVLIIMRARAKVRLLRYDGMRSNRYFGHGIEGHIVADPDVVADRQIPRVGYPYTRSDENALSDLRAK